MRGLWERAGDALLAEAGLSGPQQSAIEVAEALGIEVVIAPLLDEPARLMFGIPHPFILADAREDPRLVEEAVAVELGRWALRREGLDHDDLGARRAAERIIGVRPQREEITQVFSVRAGGDASSGQVVVLSG